MNTRTHQIAVLDDESGMLRALGRLLSELGLDAALFSTARDLLASLQISVPDCLILDLHMPEMTGFEVLTQIKTLGLNVKTLVITGHDEPGNSQRALDLGAAEYLLKPIEESVLIGSLIRACPAIGTLDSLNAG